ncbi:MAG: leucine-rich repeat domain-containing protein, partial [Sedimentisphaerales bacterium]
DLDGNRLSGLPTELGALENLEQLHLHNNRLTILPAEPRWTSGLLNLQTLTLNDNQLTCLPVQFGDLRNLVRLDLRNNHLTSIPVELGQLTHLESLKVDGNVDLTSPPPEVVKEGTEAVMAYLRTGLWKRYQRPIPITAVGGSSRSHAAIRRAERV